jgi:hypothetical protein
VLHMQQEALPDVVVCPLTFICTPVGFW